MLPPDSSTPKSESQKGMNWLRIGKIYTFSSDQVFKEILPPRTPFLVPSLFISIVSAIVLWVIVPVVFDRHGTESETHDHELHTESDWEVEEFEHDAHSESDWELEELDIEPHAKSDWEVGKFVQSVIIEVPFEVFGYVIGMVLLGTYYFGIARFFRIDNIWWEHWFAFAWWTHIPLILANGATAVIDVYSDTEHPSFLVSSLVIGLCFLLPIVWAMSLSVRGLRIWTHKGWAFCLSVSTLPYLLLVLLYSRRIVEIFLRALS